jgi:hypothetical protein
MGKDCQAIGKDPRGTKAKGAARGVLHLWIRSFAIYSRGKGLGRFDYEGPQPPVGELLSSEPTPMATG